MPRDFETLPGVDLFWEQADRDDSGEHPLERELGDRLDAMARYRRLIAEAQASGRERAAELLLQQHRRESEQADRLRDAIERMSGDRGGR